MKTPDGKKTQYVNCYVPKYLNRLAQSVFETQTQDEDRKWVNTLGSQQAVITIDNLFFEINGEGYIEGRGVINSINFNIPEKD